MRKRLLIMTALIIGLSGCTTQGKDTSVTKSEFNNSAKPYEISLRLKWLHQAQFAGFYTAEKENLYKDSNLKVTINPGGPDISSVQMVVSGTDKFGITGADQIILAREKGVPVIAVAVIYKQSPVALATLKKNNITKPKELEGKRVAVAYGRDEEVIYKALLKKEGVDRAKITETPLLFDLSQISTEKVDAQIVYEMNEPVLLKQKGFEANLIKPRDYGIKFYSDTLFTTEDMVKNHPDEVRKFVKASIEGWNRALANPEKATEYVLSANNSLDKDHQLQFLKLSSPLISTNNNIGESEMATWEEMQNLLIDQGVQKNKVDLSKVYSSDFLK